MGMTDNQFAAFRRQELGNFEEMLQMAIDTNADKRLIGKLEKEVAKAKKDIEK